MSNKRDKKEKNAPPPIVRCRDLIAILTVMLLGSVLVATLMMKSVDDAFQLTITAFGIAAILLVVGYGGGAVYDRMSRRYALMTRPRFLTRFMVLMIPVCIAMLVWGWVERATVYATVSDSTADIVDTIKQKASDMKPRQDRSDW